MTNTNQTRSNIISLNEIFIKKGQQMTNQRKAAPKSFQINPQTLKKYMELHGFKTNQSLNAKSGVSVKTIGRILKDRKINTNQSNAERLADAFRTTPYKLTQPYQEEEGSHPFFVRHNQELPPGIKISKNAKEAYGKVTEQFPINESDLIELAPIMFMILANQSLESRQKDIEQFEKDIRVLDRFPTTIVSSNLASNCPQSYDFDGLVEIEKENIKNFDIFNLLGPKPNKYNKSNPLLNYLMVELNRINSNANTPLKVVTNTKLYRQIQNEHLDNPDKIETDSAWEKGDSMFYDTPSFLTTLSNWLPYSFEETEQALSNDELSKTSDQVHGDK